MRWIVDGNPTNWAATTAEIPVGTSVTITASDSFVLPSVNNWLATAGTHTVTAFVNDVNRFQEITQSNNTLNTTFTIGQPTIAALPDVIVTSVIATPVQPIDGQKVVFSANIKNIGTSAVPAGTFTGIKWSIDGVPATWGVISNELLPGASVAIVARDSFPTPGINTWTAKAGNYTLTAFVDDVNRYVELNENNNKLDLALSVTAAPVVVTPTPTVPNVTNAKLVGLAGKCLDALNNRTSNGTQMVIYTCHGGPNQRFDMNSAGEIRIKSANNVCLDVNGASTLNRSKVQLWTCNLTVAQKWTYNTTSKELKGPGGKCLDVRNSNKADLTVVQIYSCNGTNAQKWSFVQ